jgi:hypothetical protein
MGALFFTACATDGLGSNPDQIDSYSAKGPSDGDEVDLTGGYATGNEALEALGYVVWTDYVEHQNAAEFWISFHQVPDDHRPWIAALSYTDEEPGYRITSGEFDGDGTMIWVDSEQQDYWVCTFQADFIAVMDPESDPQCLGWVDEALRIQSEDAEIEDFALDGPGHLVLEEE